MLSFLILSLLLICLVLLGYVVYILQAASMGKGQANVLDKMKETEERLVNFARDITARIAKIPDVTHLTEVARKDRKELVDFLERFKQDMNDFQRERFDAMARRQGDLVKTTGEALEGMRKVVDEKLQKTLESRLGESFKVVSDQLQAVQRGLGEMQNLAIGVGDLKKVLSNVKTRGILGEIQLESLLEQVMSPEQYAAQVSVGGEAERVDFSIKMPGKGAGDVYLPIDAKFPQEDYLHLQSAYETGNKDALNAAKKSLATAIKKAASDIKKKYIKPPYTTDFAVLYIPTEGLFAEVLRYDGLVVGLQRDFKVMIAGPTTLSAFLNSLQMGFRTFTIQKRSSEVWEVLKKVKEQFNLFGGVLRKAQEKLRQADSNIEQLVTTRTHAIVRNLDRVETLPISQEQSSDGVLTESNIAPPSKPEVPQKETKEGLF